MQSAVLAPALPTGRLAAINVTHVQLQARKRSFKRRQSRLTAMAEGAAAPEGSSSAQDPASRRAILTGTFKLLAAAGLVAGEQVRPSCTCRRAGAALARRLNVQCTNSGHPSDCWVATALSNLTLSRVFLQATAAATAATAAAAETAATAADAAACTGAAADLALPALGGAALGAAASAALFSSKSAAERAGLEEAAAAASAAAAVAAEEQQQRLSALAAELAAVQEAQKQLQQQMGSKALVGEPLQAVAGCCRSPDSLVRTGEWWLL